MVDLPASYVTLKELFSYFHSWWKTLPLGVAVFKQRRQGQLKSIEAHLADSTLPRDLRPLYEAKKKKTGGFTEGGWTKKEGDTNLGKPY